ncbi:MAG: hypothetical protein M0Z69_01750 [Actinomycetota bacterium]|nr:hypothetical protein [Actinomycetota bacterium]
MHHIEQANERATAATRRQAEDIPPGWRPLVEQLENSLARFGGLCEVAAVGRSDEQLVVSWQLASLPPDVRPDLTEAIETLFAAIVNTVQAAALTCMQCGRPGEACIGPDGDKMVLCPGDAWRLDYVFED